MDADVLVHRDLTERVIGAFYSTYNELGFGFLESVYENALAFQLENCGLKVLRQHPIVVNFRGRVVGEFRADLFVEDVLLVEIKSARSLVPVHEAQLLNYLKATGLRLGLLANFGPRPEFRRLVF
ncbi:MAG: GxxExxY protein [Luteimonas sp.]